MLDENIRFAEFAEIRMNDRKKDLRPRTYARYESMLPRINAAIGHIKLCRLQPMQELFTPDGDGKKTLSGETILHHHRLISAILHTAVERKCSIQIPATGQNAAGVPITTVSKRLGHSNTETTGRIYAHAIKSSDDTAAEKLDDIFNNKQDKPAVS